jgi:hypothetical protein
MQFNNPSPFGKRLRAHLGFIGLAMGMLAGAGCANRAQPTKAAVRPTREAEDTFSVADTLRKSTDVESSRNAIEQLNLYIGNHPELKPRPLDAAEQSALRDQFALDAGEMAEVESSVFTPLDAHHFQFCMLLRDALRSLRLEDRSPLDKATAGFNWVVRQIAFEERQGDACPPDFVLRRGWGTALERSLVFMSVLHQLGIDGCMILVSGPKQESPMGYWIPGALVDNEIYLFDTRLGLALPGGPNKIATLKQLRAQPQLLKNLSADPKLPYDVSAEQVKKLEILASCNLSAMSPRMQYLNDVLAPVEGVRLWGDPANALKRFQHAVANDASGIRVRGWNQTGDVNTPVRVARYFLPKSEGGVDSSSRRDRTIAALLVPMGLYPPPLRTLQGEPGMRLQGLFANPYPIFTLEAKMPRASLQSWLPGLYNASPEGVGSQKSSDLVERERMPRDLMLHGRLDEATNALITIRDELRRQRSVAITEGLVNDVMRWCNHAVEVYGTYLRLERDARDPKSRNPVDPATLDKARQMKDELWTHAQAVQLLVQKVSAEYMSGEVAYLIALCKQEQAERIQGRIDQARKAGKSPSSGDSSSAKNSWTGAAGWWNTYLEEFPTARGASAARIFKARALDAFGDHSGARSVLSESTRGQPSFQTMARLYLAKQLEGK